MPTREEFEGFLAVVCADLTEAVRTDHTFRNPTAFQDAVGATLAVQCDGTPFDLDDTHTAQVFPDFTLGPFGVEVKYTQSDS